MWVHPRETETEQGSRGPEKQVRAPGITVARSLGIVGRQPGRLQVAPTGRGGWLLRPSKSVA